MERRRREQHVRRRIGREFGDTLVNLHVDGALTDEEYNLWNKRVANIFDLSNMLAQEKSEGKTLLQKLREKHKDAPRKEPTFDKPKEAPTLTDLLKEKLQSHRHT
jgi:hypothetical protein